MTEQLSEQPDSKVARQQRIDESLEDGRTMRTIKLREEYDVAMRALTQTDYKLALPRKLTEARTAFAAALDLQGLNAIEPEEFEKAMKVLVDLKTEQQLQAVDA